MWEKYNILNIKGKYLFRFLNEENLDKFLNSGSLWFSRADQFGDKLECVRLREITSKSIPNVREIEARKRKYLICCFHESTKESLAFWDTYATSNKKRRKYAIVFDRLYLTSLIENCDFTQYGVGCNYSLMHGKVKYKTMVGLKDESLIKKKVKHVSFRKEGSFAYEREYRYVIKRDREFQEIGSEVFLGQTSALNFKIFVNPLLKMKEYKRCVNKIQNSSFARNLSQSALTKWLKPELW